ncbi:NAD-dependent epimerase/dehydratase family protein [Nitrospirillum amazonense]|uniref:NAD-dependent epimerase/dehydratase domain-containing protein n=1 Tax=Nitrospirillum amazonense TaxID=28077 RepID=A0A560JDS4_9PROT|nr:NAD-dependent epimerase/dehydratase family protein [Nitrospirillum amazonense]MDG3438846.1 NAD(P)-dependent oxidoreductase [Nitrospirillum amazonense]TWB69351.1 hypothetical protein FBZ87_109192 [Nitrospirillum amazonense]
MADGLIGHTGFVGTNLGAAHTFAGLFNSKNIAELDGSQFDVLVCAAAPATMWAANKDPENDLQNIYRLLSHIERARAERFVLISTIAVLADPVGLDESTNRFETGKAYGRNRRFLEEACTALFPRCHVLRLPALFGSGLKKNFLFDILNPAPSFLSQERYKDMLDRLPHAAVGLLKAVYEFDQGLAMYRCARERLIGANRGLLVDAMRTAGFTALNFTNPDSSYQYYGLARLWSDIGVVIRNELPVVHLAPEPLRAGDIYQFVTGHSFSGTDAATYHEDMKTLHADLLGGSRGYIQDRASVLSDISTFFRSLAAS